MSDSAKSILELASPAESPRELLLAARMLRIEEILKNIRALRTELRQLSGTNDLKQMLEQATCLRCGYVWWPRSPFTPPRNCARCGSLAWNRPPTERSRKPGDPEPKWWRGRRQSRKGGPRKIVRFKGAPQPRGSQSPPQPQKSLLELAMDELTNTREDGIAAIPPPPAIDRIVPPPPSPQPVWSGSLSARLREEERQPESFVTAPAPIDYEETGMLMPTPPVVDPVVEEYWKTAAENLATGLKEEVAEAVEQERLSAVVDAAIEDIGKPRTDAEAEELAKAKEEAWPTTRADD